jgi:hypothetical protein
MAQDDPRTGTRILTSICAMKLNKAIEAAHRFCKPYRVKADRKFRLKDVDPGDTGGLKSDDKARATSPPMP